MKVKILLIAMVCFGLTAAAHADCNVSDCTGNSSNNVGSSYKSNKSNKSNSPTTRFNSPNNTGSPYRSNSSMTRFHPLGDAAYSYKSNITTTRLNPFKGISHSSSSHSSAMSAYDPYGNSALTNPYTTAGSSAIPDNPYSNDALTNSYATNNLQPYAGQSRYSTRSRYRGKLGKKSYDLNSTSSLHGSYGNRYSLDNVNNLYGIGDPYHIVPAH